MTFEDDVKPKIYILWCLWDFLFMFIYLKNYWSTCWLWRGQIFENNFWLSAKEHTQFNFCYTCLVHTIDCLFWPFLACIQFVESLKFRSIFKHLQINTIRLNLVNWLSRLGVQYNWGLLPMSLTIQRCSVNYIYIYLDWGYQLWISRVFHMVLTVESSHLNHGQIYEAGWGFFFERRVVN